PGASGLKAPRGGAQSSVPTNRALHTDPSSPLGPEPTSRSPQKAPRVNVQLPSPPGRAPHGGSSQSRSPGGAPRSHSPRRGSVPTPRARRAPVAPHPQLQHGGVDGGRPVPLEAGHHGAQEPLTERRLRRCVVTGALPGIQSGRQRHGRGGTASTHRRQPRSPPLPWVSSAPAATRRPPLPAPAGTGLRGHRPAARTGRSCRGSQRGTAARGEAVPAGSGRRRQRGRGAAWPAPGHRERPHVTAAGHVTARAAALYGAVRQFPVLCPRLAMASGSGTKNLDFRRKWDKDEYEKLAEKRLTEEREKKDGKPAQPVKRELLRHRDYKVDLESKLGKTIVITKTTPQSEMGGYYCNVCDCVVKDSINFLDHINGKKHQRNLGMSMRVERSTLDQVKKRFEVNKKKMEEKQKDYDFEERMKELREEEEKAKAYKKEKQREKKRRAEEDLTFEEDDEMAAVMGFSGFGSTKKSH
uniref:Zinc finger matrin-type protein 2 n=30 Tax=Sauria TaxID=32561 RepID=A0A8C5IKM1_JUNHY